MVLKKSRLYLYVAVGLTLFTVAILFANKQNKKEAYSYEYYQSPDKKKVKNHKN
jgi:hypothetical protein